MVEVVYRSSSDSEKKAGKKECGGRKERRRSLRQPFERYIFCATEALFFQGELKDYSRGGLFIKTNKPLPVGTIVTLALPYLEDKKNKCKGQVIRKTPEGIGIEFFSDPAKRATRMELL
ncbi:MAG TPA: PilZ domain-containing protein [Desulfobacterales bacterium]